MKMRQLRKVLEFRVLNKVETSTPREDVTVDVWPTELEAVAIVVEVVAPVGAEAK